MPLAVCPFRCIQPTPNSLTVCHSSRSHSRLAVNILQRTVHSAAAWDWLPEPLICFLSFQDLKNIAHSQPFYFLVGKQFSLPSISVTSHKNVRRTLLDQASGLIFCFTQGAVSYFGELTTEHRSHDLPLKFPPRIHIQRFTASTWTFPSVTMANYHQRTMNLSNSSFKAINACGHHCILCQIPRQR